MKVAFVHDWLVTYRGGERVLEALLELFPDAPIYTLFYDPKNLPQAFAERRVIFPKKLRLFLSARKLLLPILPVAIESLNLEEYDLVISSSSCVAKGVLSRPDSKHLCYLHSPMRYIWDQRQHYGRSLQKIPGVKTLYRVLTSYLRLWDTSSSTRVDKYIVNSNFVKKRVEKFYGRPSEVIHPPIRLDLFKPPLRQKKGGYYLTAGSFVPYKRFDLAIQACNKLDKPLVVAGFGPEENYLRSLAGPKTQFAIRPNASKWLELLQHADALLFPGVEDFGMVPIEAMASGTPVIAFQAGGALDYIIDGVTGSYFSEPTSASLRDCLQKFKPEDFLTETLVDFTKKFGYTRFVNQIREKIFKLIEMP